VISLVGTISGKKLKLVATSCQILKQKCTKFDFGWGSVPDLAGELIALSPPDLIVGYKGPTSKRKEGVKGKGGIKGKERY